MNCCNILIIDDDTDDIEILADAFTQSEVDNVHYVHTVMRAFMYLEECKGKEDMPKLIVTDLYLPGITGTEFLTDLKQMELYKHIPIIVLSSFKTEKDIARYKEMGVIDYLVKPSGYEEYLQIAQTIKDRLTDLVIVSMGVIFPSFTTDLLK